MNLNKPYRKRSWFIALLFHLIVLGIILVAYFSFSNVEHKPTKISVDKTSMLTANLLSVKQSNNIEISESKTIKHQAEGSKHRLIVLNNGNQNQVEIEKNNKSKQLDNQLKKNIIKKGKASLQKHTQKEHLATNRQVEAYLSSLTKYLYADIQSNIKITQTIRGNLYVTLQSDGGLNDIKIELSPQNQVLQAQLESILNQYHHANTKIETAEPIRLNIPVVFN